MSVVALKDPLAIRDALDSQITLKACLELLIAVTPSQLSDWTDKYVLTPTVRSALVTQQIRTGTQYGVAVGHWKRAVAGTVVSKKTADLIKSRAVQAVVKLVGKLAVKLGARTALAGEATVVPIVNAVLWTAWAGLTLWDVCTFRADLVDECFKAVIGRN